MCLPSGRNCGNACMRSSFSSEVASVGIPPDAGTRCRGFPDLPNRIVPSGPQAPPLPADASVTALPISQSVWTAPPDAATRFSLSSWKNAMNLPSGDQNGSWAPSVFSMRYAPGVFKGRTQSDGTPLASFATRASDLPSGDGTHWVAALARGRAVPGGIGTTKWAAPGDG